MSLSWTNPGKTGFYLLANYFSKKFTGHSLSLYYSTVHVIFSRSLASVFFYSILSIGLMAVGGLRKDASTEHVSLLKESGGGRLKTSNLLILGLKDCICCT